MVRSFDTSFYNSILTDMTTTETYPFDDLDIDTYTAGDCWWLARALYDLGAGALTIVADRQLNDHWRHMLVTTPEGTLLDIEGLHSPCELVDRYGDASGWVIRTVSEQEWEHMVKHQSLPRDSESQVRDVAHELLTWVYTT